MTGRTPAALPAKPTEATDWLAGESTTWRDVLVAGVLALAVALFALWWRAPLTPTDPWHYIKAVWEFPTRTWVPLGYTRYGLIFANAPGFLIFGNSQATYYAVPLMSAALLTMATYLIARRFWGALAGLVAVVVLFANSIILYNLTRGYPDIPAVSLVVAAAWAALQARDRDFRGRAGIGWLLIVGLLLGWAVEIRETAFLGWPLVLLVLLKRGVILRVLTVVGIPVLGWLALDVLISWWAYGEPFLKAKVLLGIEHGAPSSVPPDPNAPPPLIRSRWYYLTAVPLVAIERVPGGMWMVVAGTVALAAGLLRNGGVRLVSWGLIAVYGLNLLAGGVASPRHVMGTLTTYRYWIQYFPLVALAVAGALSVLGAALTARLALRSSPQRLVPGILAVLMLVWPVSKAAEYLNSHPTFAPNGGNALEELRDQLRDSGHLDGQVWTDWSTRRILPAYMREPMSAAKVWSAEVRSLTGSGAPKPGDYVLIYSPGGKTCDHCRDALAPWLDAHPELPDEWHLEFTSAAENLFWYRVQ